MSVGGALASAATSALIRAARELAQGSLEWGTGRLVPAREIEGLLRRGAASKE